MGAGPASVLQRSNGLAIHVLLKRPHPPDMQECPKWSEQPSTAHAHFELSEEHTSHRDAASPTQDTMLDTSYDFATHTPLAIQTPHHA